MNTIPLFKDTSKAEEKPRTSQSSSPFLQFLKPSMGQLMHKTMISPLNKSPLQGLNLMKPSQGLMTKVSPLLGNDRAIPDYSNTMAKEVNSVSAADYWA
jgi:hypothetical protein